MKAMLFGAGDMTMKFLEMEEFIHYDIQAIADNDAKKHNTILEYKGRSFNIVSAKDVMSYNYDVIIITVANLGYQLAINRQLVDIGIPASKIRVFRTAQIKVLPEVLEATEQECPANRIFFDTTNITRDDDKTGIQRVVRELYKNMLEQTSCVYPLQCINDGWITSREFECRINNDVFDNKEHKVRVENGIFFLPDIAWDIPNLFKSLCHNENVCAVIYDLIPILYPHEVSEKYKKQFVGWVDGVLRCSSKCICISKAVADDVINYYHREHFVRKNSLEIHTMNLGFDIPKVHDKVRAELQKFVRESITFLMVGTVNPRKNHALLVESMKKVCAYVPEKEIKLLMLGRGGWMSELFEERYLNEEWIEEHVLWIKDASDSEVQWAYRNCAALVYPPKAEGFGLPLVEAAHFRMPILCSDIPIFHEVVGDNADYFQVDSVDSLSEALVRWLRTDKHPDSGKVRTHTWKECAAEVLDILNDRTEPYAVLS